MNPEPGKFCSNSLYDEPMPLMRKVRTSSCHLLAEKRAIDGTWYTYYFFLNKTFLFVKTEIWNFEHLFDLFFRETSQNLSSFGQLLLTIEKCCLNVCLKISWSPKSNSCWKFQLSILIFLNQWIDCLCLHWDCLHMNYLFL